jgi:hypothetical protein
MSVENIMRPTLKGTIIEAAIGRHDGPDFIVIDGWQPAGARNRWNLTSLDDDRTLFRMIGPAGSLAEHGYIDTTALIGKACIVCCDVVMEAGKRFDMVAIEPSGNLVNADWPMIVWAEYRATVAIHS